ncbi:MAG: flagellar hook-associated protein FlgK [Nitrospinota bacterium]
MPNVYGLMDIGKTSLLTQQTSLNVTGHNISNVNTEGFSRQVITQVAGEPIVTRPGSVGSGVRISEIKRSIDQFVVEQIETEAGELGNWEVQEQALRRIEVSFNDSLNGGLHEAITYFFNYWQTLSLNPESQTARQAVIGKAQIMAESFKKVSFDISNLRKDVDDDFVAKLADANSLISDIAELNAKIKDSEASLQNANDLNDLRDTMLNELSTLIDTNRITQSGGQIAISTAEGGRPLVIGEASFSLGASVNEFDASVHDLDWVNLNGSTIDITENVSSGKLAGYVKVKETLNGYEDQLDQLASEIVRTVNELHVDGFALDGSTGINFFDPPTVSATESSDNLGTGLISSGTVVNATNVSTDDFELAFTGASTFTLLNQTTGAASGTYSFTSGATITALETRGISVSITGSVSSGDLFRVSASDRASKTMSVNSSVVLDSKKIAASKSNFAGDGTNARDISATIRSNVMGRVVGGTSGTFTFTDFYSGLVSSIGSDAKEAIDNSTLRSSVKIHLEGRREQASGVNLDEEMINLIKFQQAYTASAKLITTADEMLDTLLSMAR